jgi:hypothetical protein
LKQVGYPSTESEKILVLFTEILLDALEKPTCQAFNPLLFKNILSTLIIYDVV